MSDTDGVSPLGTGLSSCGLRPAVVAVPASIPDAPWWHSRNEEVLHGPYATREDALFAGVREHDCEPFLVTQGRRFKYQAVYFDIDRIAEDFDDTNHEYGPEDEGPSARWSVEASNELERELAAVMDAWLDRHNYRDAWAIDTSEFQSLSRDEVERLSAQAIEARRAETGIPGSVHESAVGESRCVQGDAPDTPCHPDSIKGDT